MGKPVTINHDPSKNVGNVVWMEYSDASDALEYLADVNKQPYVDMIRNKSATVRGVSIEAGYLHNLCPECLKKGKELKFYSEEEFRKHMAEEHFVKVATLEPHGMLGTALSVVLSPEEPGYAGTTIEPLTETVSQLSRLCETITKTKMEEEEYKMSKELKTPGVAIREQHSIVPPTPPPKIKEQEPEKEPSHECPEGQHWNETEGKCIPNETPPEPTKEIKIEPSKAQMPLVELNLSNQNHLCLNL